ncbi:MAG TPA: DUF433 domain-containing protein [Phycisphaerae bacterium]|nr:DUF433 domain-containing protein [Phycisphaerae bacterium]
MLTDTQLVRIDPEIMGGMPCFAGTRVSVAALWDYLEGTSTLADFLADFPTVTRDQAVAVLEMARSTLRCARHFSAP